MQFSGFALILALSALRTKTKYDVVSRIESPGNIDALERAIQNLLHRPRLPWSLPGLGRYPHRVQNIGNLPVAESLLPESVHLFDSCYFAFSDFDLAPDDLLPIG